MSDTERSLYSFNASSNTSVKVYKNRVVFPKGSQFKTNEKVVLFRNIASVELAGITKKLVIHTQADNIEINWLCGLFAEKDS